MRPTAKKSLLLSLCALVPLAGCHREPEPLSPAVSELIRETVTAQTLPASLKGQKERVRAWEEMRRFYEKRGFAPAWSDASGPLPRAGELIQTLGPLGAEGIAPGRYQPEKLEALRKEVDAFESFEDPHAQRRLADLDVELTNTFLTVAAHLAAGRLQPEKLRVDWYTKPRNVDLDARLEQALAQEGEIVKTLRGLTPPHGDYARLRQALGRYREIERTGGWPAVPAGDELKKGATGERVRALRLRLAASGDLAVQASTEPKGQPAPPAVYDDAVASAVSHFQKRHGLEVTGGVDEETLAELNVPVADRIRQIQVNMERWRWMPATLGDRYIYVNVPEFYMRLFEGERVAMEMRVVVGKDQSKTPAFSDKMTYLELNPAWNLPKTILSEEILPKLASNPGYLASHDMEVVKGWGDGEEVVDASYAAEAGQPGSPYRVRQRAGAANPLGKVKFMFPNEFDIYLHDTPADHLFDRAERDFSHGCIRLEKPVELARYLLRGDPKWTPDAIQDALTSGEHAAIKLPRPLPVHILYWTAWVDQDGTVEFRKDVYGHDETLEKALAGEPPVWIDPAALRGEVRAAK
ncbi:MAG TPA: L,D-transpeptidase family protein [Thermoanaerobaculia bacterium]|nr:L,D-transpeptidase family protein [Thermoanaerobaculia bacterium]